MEDLAAALGGSLLGLWSYNPDTDTFFTFSPGAPAFINTLSEVQYAEALWIKTSEAVDLVAMP